MKLGGWALIENTDTGDAHVTPIDDLREHTLTADCWCKPVRDEENPDIVAHNALDGREFVERGERRVQ